MGLIYRGEYRNPEMVELELEALDARVRMWPDRLTTAQRQRLEGVSEGMVVYDLTLHKLMVYTGSAWETVTSA
jgi:hypothetical protein